MTDDLEQFKAAMKAASPTPNATRRAKNLALAMENFDRHQETAQQARQSSSSIKNGVLKMLNVISSRGALTATTALVAVGLFVILPKDVVEMPELPGHSADDQSMSIPEPALEADGIEAPQIVYEPVIEEEIVIEPAYDVSTSEQARDTLGLAAPSQAKRESTLSSRSSFSGTEGVVSLPTPVANDAIVNLPESNTETFANEAENPVKVVSEEPVSTFSIDVDTASYSILRNSLTHGYLPPREAVRVEEMVNYFPYAYPAPEGEAPFQPTVSLGASPWNPDTQLLHVAIQGAPITERVPLNLVFLIDTSGSMQNANKLPLLIQSLRMMLPELDERDEIAIVTYAGSAGQVLAPTKVGDRKAIIDALENLSAGGSTAGQEGLEQAYATAAEMAKDGEVTRVLLATDGDFNVGISDPDALKDYIADQRESGTYLSVLGFGRGNLDDTTMQALAQNGNGQASYIDTLSEARKSLVDELTGALFPIANDVKIQIEFNPAEIAEYRLIGYETRALSRTDFNNDRVDAGEIGAGHSVTAIYELTPVGSPARLSDPLRYGAESAPDSNGELGFLRLRYKEPGEDTSTLFEMPMTDLPALGQEAQFGAAIAGFGQLLRGTDLGDWSYDQAITLANSAKGDDPFGYRAEAVTLMRLADSLSAD